MTASPTPKKNPPHSGDQVGGSKRKENEPLYGFVPRRVTAKQVELVLVSGRRLGGFTIPDPRNVRFCLQDGILNPFNKQPFSGQYKTVLRDRKKLPVYARMTEFYEMGSTPLQISPLASGPDYNS